MIYGQNIRLRAAERDDLDMFVHWFNDKEVSQNISIHLPLSRAREEQWFETMLGRPVEEQVLVIEIKQPGARWLPIGNCSLMDINWRNRSAEFGIVIGEKTHWNKGYGTETSRLMLTYAFNTLNLHRIMLRVFETNPRAVRAYEKAGYIQEGRLRQAEFIDGQYCDVLVMSVLRSEWVEGQG